MARDVNLGKPVEDRRDREVAESHLEDSEKIPKSRVSKVVSCPLYPVEIPGIVAANALDANDAFGTIVTLYVPYSGIIYSATFWDLDDEGTQVDLEIFKHSITQIASDAAWAPTDIDMLSFITELSFAAFDDQINSQTSELTVIGKAYAAPEGKFYIQAVCRGTPTIAAGASPRFQLQIIPDDPEWKER